MQNVVTVPLSATCHLLRASERRTSGTSRAAACTPSRTAGSAARRCAPRRCRARKRVVRLPGREGVLEPDRRLDAVTRSRHASSGSKQTMSWMSPLRLVAPAGPHAHARRACATHRRRRRRAASRCRRRRAGSAPTRTAGASGCFGRGSYTHAHVVTTPPGPTSTKSSVSASPVSGSYSCGGTSTRPSRVWTPTMRRSCSPPRKHADDRPDAAGVRVLEHVRCRQRAGLGDHALTHRHHPRTGAGIRVQELVQHAFAQVQLLRFLHAALEREHRVVRREHDLVLPARVHELDQLRREVARRVRRCLQVAGCGT